MVWVKVLRYLLRSQAWKERPAYRLTGDQQHTLAQVQHLARQQGHQSCKTELARLREELEWAIVMF